jgi:hypothetical protein
LHRELKVKETDFRSPNDMQEQLCLVLNYSWGLAAYNYLELYSSCQSSLIEFCHRVII